MKTNRTHLYTSALLASVLLLSQPFALSAEEAFQEGNQTETAPQTTTVSPFNETEAKLLDQVDPAYIEQIVQYVHDNIGGRTAGGYTDRASADYFASQFEQLGYAPFTQATSIDGTADYFEEFVSPRVTSRTGAVIQTDDRIYDAVSPNTDPNSVYKGETDSLNADAIYIENVDDAIAAPAEQVSGKIVVTYRKPLDVWNAKSTEYADAVRELQAKGAAGVIFIFPKYSVNEDGKVSSSRYPLAAITEGEEINIPVLLTPYLEGKQIVKKITGSSCCANLTISSKANTVTSNILAVKPASKPSDEYVLVGAHRDSVFGAEGVNDNLSGTANILGIAKAFQNIDTDTNIIFVLWGAEEDGLQGSKAFYDEVIAPKDWGKSHITAYYNLDMAAPAQKRNRVLTIHTPFKDEDGNPLQSPAGDLTEYNAGRLYQTSDYANTDVWSVGPDDTVDLQYFGNCSDHASISGANASPKLQYGEGIPSVYIFWGDRIGDGRNDVTEQNYHVPGDIYKWPEEEDVFTAYGDDAPFSGNYDIRRADILANIIALAVYDTADYPDLPTDGSKLSGEISVSVPDLWKAEATLDGKPASIDEKNNLVIPSDGKAHTVSFKDSFGRSVSTTITLEKVSLDALNRQIEDASAIKPEQNAVYETNSKAAFDQALAKAQELSKSVPVETDQVAAASKALQEAKDSLGYNLYRVYNRNNGEHLYTTDSVEANKLIDLGWNDEGIAWTVPVSGKALTRLYNKNSGEHHYTADPKEISALEKLGWKNEGTKWSSTTKEKGSLIHRLYNPNAKGEQEAGAHHYTQAERERDALVKLGWRYENNDSALIYALNPVK